jgi:hypothetical protein
MLSHLVMHGLLDSQNGPSSSALYSDVARWTYPASFSPINVFQGITESLDLRLPLLSPLHHSSFLLLKSKNLILVKNHGGWQAPYWWRPRRGSASVSTSSRPRVILAVLKIPYPSLGLNFSPCKTISCAATHSTLVRFATWGAQSAASSASSSDPSNSYTGDDVRRYLHEQDEALGRCWEAAWETECLEAALTTSQTALTTVEGESSAARAWLAESDARVAGRIFRSNSVSSSSCPITLFMMISSFFIIVLMEELEASN